MGTTYKILVRKPEGKRPFGSHTCNWNYSIRTDLQEIGSEVAG
jgi:hypothetical protein